MSDWISYLEQLIDDQLAAEYQAEVELYDELADDANEVEQARINAANDADELSAQQEAIDQQREVFAEPGQILSAEGGAVEFFVDNGVPTEEGKPIAVSDVYGGRGQLEKIVQQINPAVDYVCHLMPLGWDWGDRHDGLVVPGLPEYGFKPNYVEGRYRAVNEYFSGKWWRLFPLDKKSICPGKDITVGRLEAFIENLLEDDHGYGGVAGWIVALTPVGQEGQEWLAMRDGQQNCVATAVLQAYGDRITPDKELVIRQWEARVRANGCSDADLRMLASQLKIQIRVVDLAGEEVIEQQQTYGSHRRVVTIYRSDGHAALEAPERHTPRAVVLYDQTAPQLPADASDSQRALAYEASAAADIERVVREYGLRHANVCGNEIVAQDGVVYRPFGLDRALHEMAIAAGERIPLDGDAHTPITRLPQDENPSPILEIGGKVAFVHRRWLERFSLRRLWVDAAPRWRAAQVEEAAWWSGEDTNGAESWDVRSAYLATDARTHMASGPAADFARRFGWPAGGRQRYAPITSIDEVRSLQGAVHFTSAQLQGLPAPIAYQLNRHLQCSAWLPIPLVVYLAEGDHFAQYTVDLCMFGPAARPLEFSCGDYGFQINREFSERDLGVRLIGSCARAEERNSFYTCDEAEAAHFCRAYGARRTVAGNGYLVSYSRTDEHHRDHSFVRAYVLAYNCMAMCEANKALGDAVLASTTDSVLVRRGTDVRASRLNVAAVGQEPLWGQFRLKAGKQPQRASPAVTYDLHMHEGDQPRTALPQLPVEDALHQLQAFIGPGGTGKTHYAMSLFGGRRCTVLCPTNALAADAANDGKNTFAMPVMTYHQFLRISDADDCAAWNPAEKLGPSIAQHDAVVWDEIGCVPPELLRKATAFLVRSGVQVVLCGDPLGQVQAIGDDQSGDHIMRVIEDLGARVKRFTTDYRAKNCPRLQAAKQRAWCASTEEQAAALEQVARKCTRIEMLTQLYRPGDLVLATANELVDDLRKQMAAVAGKRFPDAPVQLTFRPRDAKPYKKKGGKIPLVALPTGAMVEAIIGAQYEVPARTTYDDRLWQAGSASTVHAVQGQTIRSPRRIFICMNRMRTQNSERGDWAKNALYVAMSRAESADQLYVFWK